MRAKRAKERGELDNFHQEIMSKVEISIEKNEEFRGDSILLSEEVENHKE